MACLLLMYEPYTGVCHKILCKHKFFDNLAVLQCITACFCVVLSYANLPITYSTYTSVFAKSVIRQHMLAKTSRFEVPLGAQKTKETISEWIQILGILIFEHLAYFKTMYIKFCWQRGTWCTLSYINIIKSAFKCQCWVRPNGIDIMCASK